MRCLRTNSSPSRRSLTQSSVSWLWQHACPALPLFCSVEYLKVSLGLKREEGMNVSAIFLLCAATAGAAAQDVNVCTDKAGNRRIQSLPCSMDARTVERHMISEAGRRPVGKIDDTPKTITPIPGAQLNGDSAQSTDYTPPQNYTALPGAGGIVDKLPTLPR